jgi:hypothetical protein
MRAQPETTVEESHGSVEYSVECLRNTHLHRVQLAIRSVDDDGRGSAQQVQG